MKDQIYLGLGANVGKKEETIKKAIEMIDADFSIQVLKTSSLIETKAQTRVKQPDFINAAIEIRTILTPTELLRLTQKIENELGRTSKGTYDPRTIDIDILFYGDEILADDDLVIPHPMVQDREFVLKPLAEIAPNFCHPIFQESVEIMLKNVAFQ